MTLLWLPKQQRCLPMAVKVIPHDPRWAHVFQCKQDIIVNALGNIVTNIHHIGSTSITGLWAKPIIDIILEVTSLDALDQANTTLETMNYEAMGEFGILRRRFFRKGPPGYRTHHIHAFVTGDAHVIRHIAFRDYLKAHPLVKQAYQDLKINVAKLCNHSIEAYCQGKDAFIKAHETKALLWIKNFDQSHDQPQ